MKKVLSKEFNGVKVYSFIWKGQVSWIAVEVAKAIGYVEKSKPIGNCIKREKFEDGVEYEMISGDELKELKKLIKIDEDYLKFSPKLVLFHEIGLYGFLQYTKLDIGIEFRTWIRREVLPEIREKGYYAVPKVADKIKIKVETEVNNTNNVGTQNNMKDYPDDFDVDKFQRLRIANDTIKIFKSVLDDITLDSKYKFLLMKKIFIESGINLPTYIEEELM
ncbi:BRO family protein [uncultured Clostridium sp.]|uniref:BRO family protein n=1 Tax=uncultured Clostridium sp. TaxID=59620 RepID=UPI00262B1B7D|nr:BRO family protein [uncultured Clostridium sp.]